MGLDQGTQRLMRKELLRDKSKEQRNTSSMQISKGVLII